MISQNALSAFGSVFGFLNIYFVSDAFDLVYVQLS